MRPANVQEYLNKEITRLKHVKFVLQSWGEAGLMCVSWRGRAKQERAWFRQVTISPPPWVSLSESAR